MLAQKAGSEAIADAADSNESRASRTFSRFRIHALFESGELDGVPFGIVSGAYMYRSLVRCSDIMDQESNGNAHTCLAILQSLQEAG